MVNYKTDMMMRLTEGHSPVAPKKGFKIHLLVFLLTTPLIWLLWYLTGSSYPWPLWSTPAWATGLLFHYLAVFVFKKAKNN